MIDNSGRFDIYSTRLDPFGSREQGPSKNAMNSLSGSESHQERIKLIHHVKQW